MEHASITTLAPSGGVGGITATEASRQESTTFSFSIPRRRPPIDLYSEKLNAELLQKAQNLKQDHQGHS